MSRANSMWFRSLLVTFLCLRALFSPLLAQQAPQPPPGQQIPDSGRLLNETLKSLRGIPNAAPNIKIRLPERPTLALPAGETVEVLGFRITGNTVYKEETLQALLTPYRGQTLTFAQLVEATEILTRHYQERGFFLTQAYLPAQRIQNGIVEIAVLEGRIGNVHVNRVGKVRLKESVARGILRQSKRERVATEQGVERGLLLLSDLPGISVSATLQPGDAVGTSDLYVDYAESKPFGITPFVDNYGSRYTGDIRPGLTVSLNDGARVGDFFSLYGLISGTGGLEYLSPSYLAPLGTSGLKLGLSYSYLNYELGSDFAPLRSQGDGNVATVSLWYPMVRSQKLTFISTLAYDHKDLKDDINAVNSHSKRNINEVTLAFSHNNTDTIGGGGLNTSLLSVTVGNLNLGGALKDSDHAVDGPHSDGGFTRFNYGFSRLQHVRPNLGFYLGINGQIATKNLDTSEQMVLGGPGGVRAYPVGEGSADEGYVVNAELRYVIPTPHRNPGQLTALLFYDYGDASIFHDPRPIPAIPASFVPLVSV